MDRKLSVLKDGYLFAELNFSYERRNSGKVHITMYRSLDIEDSKSVFPLFESDNYFDHGDLRTMDEVKAYDQAMVRDQREPMDGKIEYMYEPQEYRYLLDIPRRSAVGIVTILVNYTENTKEMRFLSARRQKEDINMATHALESNRAFVNRIFDEYLDGFGGDMKEIGWN